MGEGEKGKKGKERQNYSKVQLTLCENIKKGKTKNEKSTLFAPVFNKLCLSNNNGDIMYSIE